MEGVPPKRGVRVMATGVFDILHPGHLYFLEEARRLGDELVVVVARDLTAKKLKREPIVPEHLRLEMVRGMKPVDHAVLGNVDDYFRVVQEWSPDIIAFGHDQRWDPDAVAEGLAARGLHPKMVRVPQLQHDLMATRRIIERILAAANQGRFALKGDPGEPPPFPSPEFLGDPPATPPSKAPARTRPRTVTKGRRRRTR